MTGTDKPDPSSSRFIVTRYRQLKSENCGIFFFVLLVICSVMVIIGVRLFRFTLHGSGLIDLRFLRFPKASARMTYLCSTFPPSWYTKWSISPLHWRFGQWTDIGIMPKRGIFLIDGDSAELDRCHTLDTRFCWRAQDCANLVTIYPDHLFSLMILSWRRSIWKSIRYEYHRSDGLSYATVILRTAHISLFSFPFSFLFFVILASGRYEFWPQETVSHDGVMHCVQRGKQRNWIWSLWS